MNCSICDCSLAFDKTFKKVYESFIFDYKKKNHSFPLPNMCFSCTRQRLLSFTNEMNIYKSKDSDGHDIISMYSPDKPYEVYTKEKWYTASWNGLDYRRKFDLSKSFFDQFRLLRQEVPVVALNVVNSENSEFNNNIINSKNCYMCFGNESLEDCLYVTGSYGTKYSIDVWWSTTENSYEIFNCGNVYKSYFCSNCTESRDLILCDNCFGCKNCIMCSNLVNQEYHILNKKYSPEEFHKKKEELDFGNYTKFQTLKKVFSDFLITTPKIFSDTVQSENVTGNYIYQSKKCFNCYNVIEIEDSSHVANAGRISWVANSCIVYTGEGKIIGSTMIYESSSIAFCILINACHNLTYCTDMLSCSYCFWCVWLQHKNYCFFNTQYSQEEYFEKVEACIAHMQKTGEWGQIFPANISLFGYNETLAQWEFPLEKKDAIETEFLWSDYESPFPNTAKTITADKLPDTIESVPDDVLNWAIICERSGKPFKIIAQELEFYRKHQLPLPRLHPNERYIARLQIRTDRQLYNIKCDSCHKELQSVYRQDWKEKVYCRNCYYKNVF